MWRSVRAHGDTKTEKSKRTPRLPERAITALRQHQARQADQRLLAGELSQEHDLVFSSSVGTALDAANVRRLIKSRRSNIYGVWVCRRMVDSVQIVLFGVACPHFRGPS